MVVVAAFDRDCALSDLGDHDVDAEYLGEVFVEAEADEGCCCDDDCAVRWDLAQPFCHVAPKLDERQIRSPVEDCSLDLHRGMPQ